MMRRPEDMKMPPPPPPKPKKGRKSSKDKTPPNDWRGVLRQKADGHFVGDEFAVLTALKAAPELQGLLRYDEFTRRTEMAKDAPWRSLASGSLWTDRDDVQLQAWLQSQSVDVRARNTVADSVAVIAEENSYHPVRTYLQGLKWDGTWRLETWLQTYLGAKGDAKYLGPVGRRFLISAVARIMRPGCQADHTMVLEGEQGIRKSSAVKVLAVRDEWFVDRLPELGSADAAAQLAGHWIVELAELASIRSAASVEGVKAYLTRREDVYRPPYGRRPVTCARQCVFFGSTNESHYLRDPTGNRRFWPVKCTKVDLASLERDRDQLWAEAMMLFNEGEQWHLTAEEAALASGEQSDRVLTTELEADIAEFLAGRSDAAEVSIQEVLTGCCHLERDSADYQQQAARLNRSVALAIERAGWERIGRVGRAEKRRTIYRKKAI